MAYERREYAGAAPATTLNGAISNSTTTITLTDGTGYPTGATGPFWIVVDPALSTEEKIKCTSRTGNVITATGRGGANGDGTSAVSHTSGAVVKHVFTKTDADEANAHYADTALDHHTQYHNTARHVAVSHVIGTHLPTPATPTTVEIGTAASAGTTGPAAAEDHAHAFAGGLLAITQYRAGGAVVAYTTSSSSYADVDATNLSVAFTAPANGKVRVRLEGTVLIDPADQEMFWALREGSSNLANTGASVYYSPSGSDYLIRLSYAIYITGLVASSSHTYKWAWKSVGGDVVSLVHGADYPLTMEVWAAP